MFAIFLGNVFALFIASAGAAQVSCPNASVHGTTSPVWAYAYHNAERGTASCNRAVSIPANGLRVYASRADCRNGVFHVVGENGGGIIADSLTCTNCTAITARNLRLAVNSTAQIRAQFTFPDGQSVRYSSTLSRGVADANGRTLCSITGATLLGGGFGGDLDAPTATLGALPAPTGGRYVIPVNLSEPSTDFALSDVTLVNATATLSGAGANYSLTVTPTADGTWSAQVKQNSFTDDEGDSNTNASNLVSAVRDTTGPTVRISDIVVAAAGQFTAQITLSEASSDFTSQDLTLINATASLTGSGTQYVATLTPNASGVIGVSVPAATLTDSNGNGNQASNTQTYSADLTGPSVVISGLPETYAGVQTLMASIKFSEAVNGFEARDLSVQNASVVSLTGSAASYQVTLRTLGTGDVALRVPAGVATDAAGNANTGSNTMTARNGTAEETQKQIAQFMAARANQLVSNQPDLTCMMTGQCSGGGATLVATQGTANFSLHSRTSGPVWFRLKGSQVTENGAASKYLFGAIGAHRSITSNTIAGLMLQFDHMSQDVGTRKISGNGWMAGPYLVGKFPRQPLYYELRALGGKTNNKISPFGTYTDTFETNRFLVQAKIAGKLEYGATTVTPSLSAAYTKDDQKAYSDSLGNLIARQAIEMGQLSIGLDASRPVMFGNKVWTLSGGVAGIYNSSFGTAAAAAGANSPAHNGGRARLHASASRQFGSSGTVEISMFYDGIGARNYEAYGIEFGLRTDF